MCGGLLTDQAVQNQTKIALNIDEGEPVYFNEKHKDFMCDMTLIDKPPPNILH